MGSLTAFFARILRNFWRQGSSIGTRSEAGKIKKKKDGEDRPEIQRYEQMKSARLARCEQMKSAVQGLITALCGEETALLFFIVVGEKEVECTLGYRVVCGRGYCKLHKAVGGIGGADDALCAVARGGDEHFSEKLIKAIDA